MSDAAHEPTVCIVLHDAAPSTHKSCVRVLTAVRQVVGDAPVTILAVPRYHGEEPTAEFEAWLGERARRGDELALHGCTHRDEGPAQGAVDALRRSHYTRGEGEFWSLSRQDALARIDLGIAWFAKNRWPLSGFVAPGGKLLFGEGFWREEPTAEYLVALGAAREELRDYEGTIEAAADVGLRLLRAVTSSMEDWDRYEDAWAENGARWAAAHPDDPGVDDFRAWIAAGQERYRELGGREILGFGLFLFQRGAL